MLHSTDIRCQQTGHERDAWVRHMLLPDKPDLDAYLADFMPDGLTGRVA
jgi:hypothetical protein